VLGKRENLAAFCAAFGLTRLLEALRQRDCLLVLNYHRLGNPATCAYDTGVFSATEEHFDEQIRYLKSKFSITTLEGVQEMVETPRKMNGFHILVTFDDGYRDNFEVAFPIPRSHGVQGTFFLPTGMIGTNALPWWDQIAWAVRNTDRPFIDAPCNGQIRRIELRNIPRTMAVRHVLQLQYFDQQRTLSEFAAEVVAVCGFSMTDLPTERLLMSWPEVAELIKGGMAIGSHTHHHPILAYLPLEDQEWELRTSKQILQKELGIVVDSFAYPLGKQHTFTSATQLAAQRNNYRTGFSHYGGINAPGNVNPLDVRRVSVSFEESLERFRFRSAFSAAFAKNAPL
jgi:peptidoglycan/xylan/chitin deacetylase (PgdA/CDA1 family)